MTLELYKRIEKEVWAFFSKKLRHRGDFHEIMEDLVHQEYAKALSGEGSYKAVSNQIFKLLRDVKGRAGKYKAVPLVEGHQTKQEIQRIDSSFLMLTPEQKDMVGVLITKPVESIKALTYRFNKSEEEIRQELANIDLQEVAVARRTVLPLEMRKSRCVVTKQTTFFRRKRRLGLCPYCTKPAISGYSTCFECKEKRRLSLNARRKARRQKANQLGK